ncbi:hypothetical protein Salat_2159000 [Sesamum alatum]|uniref:Uncharacterized protein n=1 Tax=Sesamum alatum TaxID=300844 RepID=A0AAE1Y1M9_9LAMI|nr:hypothetical protein Salat_2159000 [Sesamum alatum]
MPWLVLGDFNCVKSSAEKQLGVPPTWYELKDFNDCCLSLGLHDAPTTDCFYTWYSNNDDNPVWCKLDRVLLNNEWLEAGLHCGVHFNPPGCLSNHSPGIISLFDLPAPKPKPFRFFNMWADHPNFLAIVENEKRCEKLNFGYHKSDGIVVTSVAEIGQEFVAYYTSLLGTEGRTLPMDSGVFEWGPKLSSEQALELCRARNISNSEFNFHPKYEKLKITHLLFADDLMLVSHGIVGNELDSILASTEFTRGEMPVRYLGIPLAAQRLTVINYLPLVDKIAGNISKWSAKSLSFVGRLELITSVIQGVECFWLQCFPLPAAVVDKIHRLCRNFLWNSKRASVAWEEIYHPKEEGGLGIRHIQSWNVALLARVLWNIHRKAETLWVKWVNEVYLRGASVWD